MPLPKPLRGITTPLLAPLSAPDALDDEALARLLEHIIAGGVRGVFILGTSGEGPGLSARLQRELIAQTCRHVRGRISVLVGVTAASTAESIALCEYSAREGVDAVVTAGPLYFPVSQAQLLEYTRQMAAASPLPVFLYNIPSFAHVEFGIDTVRRAWEIPNIAGLKDSGGDIIYMHRIQLMRPPEFTLLSGPEEMSADCILMGIDGGVSGGSNLFPRLHVDLYEAAARGDVATARKLQDRVVDISNRIYQSNGYGSGYLLGVKCAAEMLGLCKNIYAAPYQPLAGEHREAIRRGLEELGLLGGPRS